MAKELTFNEAIALVGEINKTLFWSASYVPPGRIEAVYHDPVGGMASSPIVLTSAEEWATYKAATDQSTSESEQLTTLKRQLEQARLQQQELQAALDAALALRQEDEQHLTEAHTLLEQAARLLSSDHGNSSGWLIAYAALVKKYPRETNE